MTQPFIVANQTADSDDRVAVGGCRACRGRAHGRGRQAPEFDITRATACAQA